MPSQQVSSAEDGAVYTTSTGAPVAEPYAAQRIGNLGPLLLQGNHISAVGALQSSLTQQTSTILTSLPILTVSESPSVS